MNQPTGLIRLGLKNLESLSVLFRQYVVLQYYIGSQFINEWFYHHFPPPEILLYILIGINCIAVCVILTAQFAKYMRAQLSPLFEATERIAALAHDLKTPLTVIQGNIDLINEAELDDEQRLYAGYITESSGQMGVYIRTLIGISRTAAGYQLNLEEIDIADYMEQIEAQANSLCLTKEICLHMETGADLGTFKADKLLLERAIINVIGNAVDYSSSEGTVYVATQKTDHFLQISITDEGSGFTPETLHHAQDQFFIGNKSRTSNMHFGMGLYITSSIIKQHNGQLILKNSEKTKGAQVIIKIPY